MRHATELNSFSNISYSGTELSSMTVSYLKRKSCQLFMMIRLSTHNDMFVEK